MNIRIKTYLAILLIAFTALFSCRISKPYSAPNLTLANLFRDSSTADTNTIGTVPYKQLFQDTILQNLIGRGLSNNLDLRMAINRIEQARQYYLQSRAAFLPSLDANASVTESKLSEATGFGIRTRATQFQLGLSTSWEADLWGRLSSSRRSNLARFLQSDAAARAVETSIVSGVANYYFSLLALDRQLAITQQTVANWDTTVTIMRALKEAATVTEAAVVQSEAQRYAAQVTIPDLLQDIRETENALSILIGSPPAVITRGSLENQEMVQILQTGVPAQLLANRPDVQQAELNFRYYFELTNVARAYFYPSFTINGSGGLTSLNFSDLFSARSIVANITAGLTQPIFNRRANRTRLEVAKLQQQEAYLDFQNIMLTAGREVSDAVSLYQTARDKMGIRINQMRALQNSVSYSLELLQNGFANYTEIITARQSLLQAELGSVNDSFQQLQGVVNLYRSLGGGWRR